MKDKLVTTILILYFSTYILIAPISYLLGINLELLREKYPTFPLILNGVYLMVAGILGIIFRNEFGTWSANYRKRLADRYPAWKKMSGLPEEKVEYYLSAEFNRKMAITAAVILLSVGFLLTAMGVLING